MQKVFVEFETNKMPCSKRKAHNIYAKAREECEENLAAMIAQVKADIKTEKERLKTVNESFSLEIR